MVLLKVSLFFWPGKFLFLQTHHWLHITLSTKDQSHWEVNNKKMHCETKDSRNAILCSIAAHGSKLPKPAAKNWIMKEQMLSITSVTRSYRTVSNTSPRFSHPSRHPPTLSFHLKAEWFNITYVAEGNFKKLFLIVDMWSCGLPRGCYSLNITVTRA